MGSTLFKIEVVANVVFSISAYRFINLSRKLLFVIKFLNRNVDSGAFGHVIEVSVFKQCTNMFLLASSKPASKS